MNVVIEHAVADQELELRIMQFLVSHHVPGLRNLHVQAVNGIVTLTGKVLTFYEKQLCNQCCRRVPGISQLINLVHVDGYLDPANPPTEITQHFCFPAKTVRLSNSA